MRSFTVLALLAAVPFAAVLSGAERSAADRPSFVERVWPSDYARVEKLFDEDFSSDSDVVFLRVNAGKPDFALTLKREESGDFTVTLVASIDDKFQKVSASLPAAVGEQVARAVELKLHRHVTIGTQSRSASKREGDLWIFHRNAQKRTSTAMIFFEATLDNPEATLFTDGLVGGLQRLIAAEDAERESVLSELDRTATKIILTDTP